MHHRYLVGGGISDFATLFPTLILTTSRPDTPGRFTEDHVPMIAFPGRFQIRCHCDRCLRRSSKGERREVTGRQR